MTYKEAAGRFFDALIQNSTSSKFKQFFYRTRATVLITLLVASAKDDEKYSLESILERIPRKLVSRTSVKYILDEAVTQKFYLKVKDNKDSRRRVYSINQKYEEEIVNLLVRYQTILSEMK
tara:strand:+ start:27 stop:389 length:363 start_codon:yes stop_codon:yes gene_type:complete